GLERDTFLYVSDFFEENEEYDRLPGGREEQGGREERGPRQERSQGGRGGERRREETTGDAPGSAPVDTPGRENAVAETALEGRKRPLRRRDARLTARETDGTIAD